MRVVKPINFSSLSFERDSAATYYNSSGILQSAASDVLRFGYDPETLAYIGPIFEGQSTNLIPQSNNFNSGWNLTANSLLGTEAGYNTPDLGNLYGDNTAFFMLKTTGAGSWEASRSVSIPAAGYYCFSIYVKAKSIGSNGKSEILLAIVQGGTFASARINTNYSTPSITYINSSAGQPSRISIKKVPNGWIRLSISINAPSSSSLTVRMLGDGVPSNGINGSGFHYIWGAQLESGDYPTSFIPTSGSVVTRAADITGTTPPNLSSSNVALDDNPEYNPATSYAIGAEVMVLGVNNRNYKSLVASNVGSFPPDNPTKWLDIGAVNRWRMFDYNVGSDLQTSTANLVDVSLNVAEKINTVALFNVVGSSATVRVYFGGSVAYEKTIILKGYDSPVGWWSFFFGPTRQVRNVVFNDLPPAVPAQIQITVNNSGDTASIGKAVVGFGRDLGFIEYGTTSSGIIDYSTKQQDSFGNYYFKVGKFVGKVDVRVVVDPGREDTVSYTLSDARAQPHAYICDTGRESLILFGRYADFTILFSTPAASYCSIQLEGI